MCEGCPEMINHNHPGADAAREAAIDRIVMRRLATDSATCEVEIAPHEDPELAAIDAWLNAWAGGGGIA